MDEIYAKSLEELEEDAWDDAPADSTSLVEEVHRLRSVKLKDMSLDDIARLLRQQVGADWLVPLALERLQEDPLAGDTDEGQLLLSVLQNLPYFERFPNDLLRLSAVRRDLLALREQADTLLSDPRWPRDI